MVSSSRSRSKTGGYPLQTVCESFFLSRWRVVSTARQSPMLIVCTPFCTTTCMSTDSGNGVAFTSTYTAQSRVSLAAIVESELLLPANDLRPAFVVDTRGWRQSCRPLHPRSLLLLLVNSRRILRGLRMANPRTWRLTFETLLQLPGS